ncbi:MAG: aminopeptidase P family protein [Acidobacteria bacterium]|nr:aminopeptidase P family protein [Acidobacteriota bacterium]
MFDAATYASRRETLQQKISSGVALFPGNNESPMNYTANPYHYRQDSTFLYYFGLAMPGLAAVLDLDSGQAVLFGDDVEMEDIIWMGPQPTMAERARQVGVAEIRPSAELAAYIRQCLTTGRPVHFLPPYRAETALTLGRLLGIQPDHLKTYASVPLIQAVVAQRAVKTAEEIEQIEQALAVAYDMHTTAMRMAKPGVYEREIAGQAEGIALAGGGTVSFPIICTINGQTLHNHYHGNELREGRLLIMDAGAETEMGYAADITRTTPVGGKFNARQKEIYEIVLKAINTSIEAIKPGIKYRQVHLHAARIVAEGLKSVGLMMGDPAEAVAQGAHALFFPHGLGHMMGLDVHDMENLGENYVGYDADTTRSDQFGLAYLRLGRELEPGFVLTVEPGIYFIPALIDQWRKEGKCTQFIDYDKVETYKDFGGIRIEDDVLVTNTGQRVLGKPIPKSVADVEAMAASG